MDHGYKCGFLKLQTCYSRIVEDYDLTNPVTWQEFIDAGFVLKVREIPK